MKRLAWALGFALLPAALSLPTSAVADEVQQLPNLVALRPAFVQIGELDEPSESPPGTVALRFTTTSANMGAYALEVHGSPVEEQNEAGEAIRAAEQCIWWVSRVCTQTTPVGHFVWHEAHAHWHLMRYALYELRTLTAEGEPDMTPAGLVVPGQKVSFCLMDYETMDEQPPGYDPLKRYGIYQFCSEYVQGISPGWADEYGYHLYGQQIPIDPSQVPDGSYALVVTINPHDDILETSKDDNRAFVRIALSESATTVQTL
ncbi:MAG TPA: lysyl oxidase family protein [Actinomycetota bacterium]